MIGLYKVSAGPRTCYIALCHKIIQKPFFKSSLACIFVDYSSAYVSIGTLRLVSKESTNSYRSGRLEVYHYQASSGSNWTTFCYSNFNSRDADIACQDLGFPRASTYGRVGTFG